MSRRPTIGIHESVFYVLERIDEDPVHQDGATEGPKCLTLP
jgi:hypothetical protein